MISRIYILFSFFLWQCHDSTMGERSSEGLSSDIAQILKENEDAGKGVRMKTIRINETYFELLYKPLCFVIASSENVPLRNEDIKPFEADYNSFIYFDLSIGTDKRIDILKDLSKNDEEYTAILKYCSFEIARDAKIVVNRQDTIPCAFSNFERSYGMKGNLFFQTGFSRPTYPIESVTFIWNDRILNKGIIKWEYELSDLQEPELN